METRRGDYPLGDLRQGGLLAGEQPGAGVQSPPGHPVSALERVARAAAVPVQVRLGSARRHRSGASPARRTTWMGSITAPPKVAPPTR